MINLGIYVYGRTQYAKFYQIETLIDYAKKDFRYNLSIVTDGTNQVTAERLSKKTGLPLHDMRSYTLDNLKKYYQALIMIDPYDKPYFDYKDIKDIIVAKIYGCAGVEVSSDSLYHKPLIKNSKIIVTENSYMKSVIKSLYPYKAVLVESPAFDYDTRPNTVITDPYDSKKLNIIWSPHYSMIDFKYIKEYLGVVDLTFEMYKDTIIDLANKYSDKVKILFVPHPNFNISYQRKYKRQFNKLVNEFEENGIEYLSTNRYDYHEIFNNSNLIINDCISFIQEWLPQNKPMIVLGGDIQEKRYSVYGESLIDNCYYKVKSTDELKKLFSKYVDDPYGFDTKKSSREIFIKSLYKDSKVSNSESLLSDLYDLLTYSKISSI